MEKIIKIISLLVVAIGFAGTSLFAQNCETQLIPYIQDEIKPLPEETRSYLETKLTQLITQNDISVGAGYGQFYLLSKFTLLSADVVPGSPKIISQRINVSLSIVDYFGKKVIASTNIELQATGTNENKAYINGIRNLNPENPKIQTFIKSGKEKMLAYYDNNISNIVKKAQNLTALKQYEEALFLLSSVPECSKGYDQAISESQKVYTAYIDNQCRKNLIQARAAWAASPNADGAAEARKYLVNIDPEATCHSEATTLLNEIKKAVKDDWDYEFKNYDDRALERERINAFREVGTAYGKGQQPNTIILDKIF
jgi:hypothetical protein